MEKSDYITVSILITIKIHKIAKETFISDRIKAQILREIITTLLGTKIIRDSLHLQEVQQFIQSYLNHHQEMQMQFGNNFIHTKIHRTSSPE